MPRRSAKVSAPVRGRDARRFARRRGLRCPSRPTEPARERVFVCVLEPEGRDRARRTDQGRRQSDRVGAAPADADGGGYAHDRRRRDARARRAAHRQGRHRIGRSRAGRRRSRAGCARRRRRSTKRPSRPAVLPVVEQALAALHVDMAVRPIPQVPDRREDTTSFAAIIVDDPPGFTAEQRHALSSFVESGGVLLVALGRACRGCSARRELRAAALACRGVGLFGTSSPVSGVDVSSGATFFGEAASSLADLAPRWPREARRARRVGVRARSSSGVTARRSSVGARVVAATCGWPRLAVLRRGERFRAASGASSRCSTRSSNEAKQRATPRRGDVGTPWAFAGAGRVEAVGPQGPLTATRDDGTLRLVPVPAGAYRVSIDGNKELRVAAPLAREMDLRPRAVAPSATSSALGGGVAIVDVRGWWRSGCSASWRRS